MRLCVWGCGEKDSAQIYGSDLTRAAQAWIGAVAEITKGVARTEPHLTDGAVSEMATMAGKEFCYRL